MSHDPSPSLVASIQVVLVEPEIPQNTGNIIRLCANTGAGLHLIEPLGFPLDDAKMRRAGLDYHERTRLKVYPSWSAFWAAQRPPIEQCYALTSHGQRNLYEVAFHGPVWLFFGSETRGLSPEVRAHFPEDHRLRLPMRPGNRSLNLSNAVAVTVYEAWRQQGWA